MRRKNYRKIWENHNGPIPVDSNGRSYEIHHIDGNRENNNINNLQCIPIEEHLRIHETQGDESSVSLIRIRMGLPPLESWNHKKETIDKVRDSNSGKIWINDGKNITWIKKGEKIPNGWVRGMTIVKKIWINNGKINKHWDKSQSLPKGWKIGLLRGNIWINKDNKQKRINQDKLYYYLDNGWDLGIGDRKWVNNGVKSKRVIKNEIQKYLDLGWKLGKTMSECPPPTKEVKLKISNTILGSIGINNGKINTFIKKNEPIPEGFVKGFIKKLKNG